jgi:formate-dependent nitrite reductase membrane component NrfD
MSTSYYGRPVVKPHVWTPYIPVYFWIGGTAGAAALHAGIERAKGNGALANVQRDVALAGALTAPILLTLDLGVPLRFYNMLRVFKVTSPMSIGSWILVMFGGSITGATVFDVVGMKSLARTLEAVAAALGPALATYTAVLLSDTATPIWHEAHTELPFVFIASGMAGAGACGTLFAPPPNAGSARRMMTVGALAMTLTARLMERRLGRFLAEAYRTGKAGSLKRTSELLATTGALLGLVSKRNVVATRAAALAVIAAGVCERFAVLAAGKESARDPKYTIEPQRQRATERYIE